jgi:hypothetical protein
MCTPISESTYRSRARRDYASGRIASPAEALGCLDGICRRLTSTRRPGSPNTSAPFSSYAPKVNFVTRVPRRLNSLKTRADGRQTRAQPPGPRAVNATIDVVDPGDARIAMRCWSCHADISRSSGGAPPSTRRRSARLTSPHQGRRLRHRLFHQ